jgi:ABC-type transport system substrate-binding protein
MSKQFSVFVVAALTLALSAFPAGAQKKGGTLTFATPSVQPGLDPARTNTGDQYMLTAMIFSNLTRIDHELNPKPQLASSWEANADSTEWTFHLVKNAKFHNGRPIVADDVKFSIGRILDPKTASKGAKAMGPIEEIVVKDPHTVVFKLSGPTRTCRCSSAIRSDASSPRKTSRTSAISRSAAARSS